MNLVEVNAEAIERPPWAARCAGFARKALRRRGIRNWELSILLCDDLTIRELNRRYRGVDSPTDVLAFSQEAEDWPAGLPGGGNAGDRAAPGGLGAGAAPPRTRAAGDIVISLETMRRNAASRDLAAEEELKRLVIHGILHLEGLDHPEGESEMFEVQECILESLRRERIL